MALQSRYLFLLKYFLPFLDLLMFNLLYLLASRLAANWEFGMFKDTVHNHILVANLIWLICSAFFGLYTVFGQKKIEKVYRATLKSVGTHLVLFPIYLIVHEENHFSLVFVLILYGLLILGFVLSRFIGTALHIVFNERYRSVKKVALLGSSQTSLRLSHYFKGDQGLVFYGNIGGDECIYFDKGTSVSEIVNKKFARAADAGVNEIYATVIPDRMSEIQPLLQEADRQGIRMKLIPDLGVHSSYGVGYFSKEFTLITMRPEPLEDMGNRFKKRAFDLIFSTFVIIFILSWLYPIVAFLIKIESEGPVLFKQKRSGRKNVPFDCYKFRSMRYNESSDELQATKKDTRVTVIGSFLRKSSLDEMPQFFNVFLGNMSVVGPRPHMLAHTEMYKDNIDKFMVRHAVKPGITGWAQVHGFRGETRENSDMENRVKYDIFYLENWTAMLDVRVIFMTIVNIVRGEENAY